MSARLAAHIWVAAHLRRVEIEGAAGHVARRGDRDAGAVALKLVTLGLDRGAPNARAVTRATLGDGALGWSWLVGPDPAPEPDVDRALRSQAAFDPDLWIIEIEDRNGRHFLEDPVG